MDMTGHIQAGPDVTYHSQKNNEPCCHGNEYESFGNDGDQWCLGHFRQTVGAHGIHAQGKNRSPVERAVA